MSTTVTIELPGGTIHICADDVNDLAGIAPFIKSLVDDKTTSTAAAPAPEPSLEQIDTPAPLAAVTPIKPPVAPAPAAMGDELRCPECSKVCASKQGLGKHRSFAHGYQSPQRPTPGKAKTTPAAPPAGVEPGPVGMLGPQPDVLLLRCGDTDCDFVVRIHEHAKLRHHARAEHDRQPTADEGTPRYERDLSRGGVGA